MCRCSVRLGVTRLIGGLEGEIFLHRCAAMMVRLLAGSAIFPIRVETLGSSENPTSCSFGAYPKRGREVDMPLSDSAPKKDQ